jgi:hypothetical protein
MDLSLNEDNKTNTSEARRAKDDRANTARRGITASIRALKACTDPGIAWYIPDVLMWDGETIPGSSSDAIDDVIAHLFCV